MRDEIDDRAETENAERQLKQADDERQRQRQFDIFGAARLGEIAEGREQHDRRRRRRA